MRLQLNATLVAAVVAAAAPLAAADPGAEASLRVYADDDDITVISPSVHAEAPIGATRVDVDATADAVSGASIDVVTSASPRAISEQRVELGLAATRAVPRRPSLTATAELRGSHENDHDAWRARARLALELLDRQLTLAAGYRAGADAIGSAMDPAFHGERVLHELTATASVVMDARTLLDLTLEGASTSGYQASPYRRVPLVAPAWPTPTWMTEAVPGSRRTLAAAVRLRRALGATWFATLGYRGYADTWSMTSHTVAAECRWQIAARVLAGVAVRGYRQDAADFYRAVYTDDGAVPTWRTRDRTLGAMRTVFASGTVDAALGEDTPWHATAAVGVLASWFLDFPLQSDRHALLITLSLARTFGGV